MSDVTYTSTTGTGRVNFAIPAQSQMTTTKAGNVPYTYTCTVPAGLPPIAATLVGTPPTILNTPPTPVTATTPYNFTFATSGSSPLPTTFSLTSGSLPPGLTLSASGTIAGSATTIGTFNATVQADNGIAPAATESFTITVNPIPPSLTGNPPSPVPVDSPYNFAFTMNGYPTPTTSVTAGALPPGLSLSSAGALSGTPTTPGTYNATVTATNGGTPDATDTFTITVTPSISVGDESVVQSTTGTATMDFAVTLSQPSHTQLTVHYTTVNGTAIGGTKAGTGIDYQTKSGTLTFTPSAATGLTPVEKTIAITVYPQPATSAIRAFQVALSAPTGGYLLNRANATGTVVSATAVAGVGVGIAPNAGVPVTTAGAAKVYLPVTLTTPSSSALTVTYTITPGSATYSKTANGGDYGGNTTGKISFAVGTKGVTAVAKTLAIPIWPDANPELDETFTVTIAVTSGTATLSNATATVTIYGINLGTIVVNPFGAITG
jgi:hypothetical protein